MPSIDPPLAGTALHYRLDDDHRPDLIDADLLAKRGGAREIRSGSHWGLSARVGRWLLTTTLSGEIRFPAGSDEWRLVPGTCSPSRPAWSAPWNPCRAACSC